MTIGLTRISARSRMLTGSGCGTPIPPDSEVRDYGLWTFSNAEEFKVVSRIRDEVVDVYARPLWEDPDRLAV